MSTAPLTSSQCHYLQHSSSLTMLCKANYPLLLFSTPSSLVKPKWPGVAGAGGAVARSSSVAPPRDDVVHDTSPRRPEDLTRCGLSPAPPFKGTWFHPVATIPHQRRSPPAGCFAVSSHTVALAAYPSAVSLHTVAFGGVRFYTAFPHTAALFCFDYFISIPLHVARRAMAAAVKGQRQAFQFNHFLPQTSSRSHSEASPPSPLIQIPLKKKKKKKPPKCSLKHLKILPKEEGLAHLPLNSPQLPGLYCPLPIAQCLPNPASISIPPPSRTRLGIRPTCVSLRNSSTAGIARGSLNRVRTERARGPPHSQSAFTLIQSRLISGIHR